MMIKMYCEDEYRLKANGYNVVFPLDGISQSGRPQEDLSYDLPGLPAGYGFSVFGTTGIAC